MIWVVGAVVPPAGILVTGLVSRPGSSAAKAAKADSADKSPVPAVTQSSAAAEPAGTEQSAGQAAAEPSESARAAKAAFGPKAIDADRRRPGPVRTGLPHAPRPAGRLRCRTVHLQVTTAPPAGKANAEVTVRAA